MGRIGLPAGAGKGAAALSVLRTDLNCAATTFDPAMGRSVRGLTDDLSDTTARGRIIESASQCDGCFGERFGVVCAIWRIGVWSIAHSGVLPFFAFGGQQPAVC